jgi:aspartate aminotransferase
MTATAEKQTPTKLSHIAETLIGSEIIKLAGEVNEKIKNGEKIFNLTIGDFNPKIFPIPAELKQEIIAAYNNDETNYPPADGIADLRKAVSAFLKNKGGLDYAPDQIIIAGGARPLIYATFKALVDDGDTVLFPVPSWNNNHYSHLNNCNNILIETKPENNFMPTAAELKPHLSKANLVALCSPLNPTGTTFTEKDLREICDLIVAENKRRTADEKPLYLMYDQIYWELTFGNTKHYNPVLLNPEIKNYTVFIDGISKSLAATGVRVGWTFGPKRIMDKMKSILGHMGAWSPKAEQVATANYLNNTAAYDNFLTDIKDKVSKRLDALHSGIEELKAEGHHVNSIAPQAAIYLTVQFALHGKKTKDGKVLASTKDITKYLLDEAKIAIVPFYAFGSADESNWYRVSVGTCKLEDVTAIISGLRAALKNLS